MYNSSPQDRNEFEDGPCIHCGAYVYDGSEPHDPGCSLFDYDDPNVIPEFDSRSAHEDDDAPLSASGRSWASAPFWIT